MRLSRRPETVLILFFLFATNLFAVVQAPAPQEKLGDFSGYYSFIRQGESVRIDLPPIDEQANATGPLKIDGYITRFGTEDSDKDTLMDQFFKSGSYDGNLLAFATKIAHGVWYEFTGKVQRGEEKSKAKEGYYVVTGTLTEHSTDKKGKESARSRQVTLKSFPDFDAEQQK